MKLLWAILFIAPLVFMAAYLISVYQSPFTVITSSNGLKKDFTWNTYTDKLHNGNSEISKSPQVPFEYKYCLKEGYRFKFAVLGISPKDSNHVDLSVYNQMDIVLKSKAGKGILFYLYTAFPEDKKLNHPSWPHQYILNADTSFTAIQLSLDQFYTPDWWYTEVNETRASLGSPLFDKTMAMSFGNCVHIKTDTPDVVTVKDMTFSVNLWPHFIQTLPYIAGYYLLLLAYLFIQKRKRKKLVFMEANIPFAVNKKEETVFHFMGIHYYEPNYSIEKLASQTGLSESSILQIIKDKTGLSFKQFLNDLRITEAERLLEQSDLPVTELAEKVGFNSREHFSRLFKSKTGLNPLELRKQKGKKIEHADQE